MNQLFSPTRFSFLFLLAAALLSACSKETDIAPANASFSKAPTIVQHASTGQLDAYTNTNSSAEPGLNINFSWGVSYAQPVGPEVATSANIDFQVNGNTVLRALSQPVAIYNDGAGHIDFLIRYSIPSMLDANTYTVVISPSDPTKSLVPASSPQAYITTIQMVLPVSPNPVTVNAYGGVQMLPAQTFSTNVPLRWDSQNLSAGPVRVYMVNSAGLIYDPGMYSQRVTFAPNNYSVSYTNNDGSEQQPISPVPDGRYFFVVGSVDNMSQNSPAATYMAAGAVDISNSPGGGGIGME